MRDYRLYLKDILAAMESIEAFVAGMDLEAFRADDKTASAVIRKFEIIGEAAEGRCWRYDKISQRLTEAEGQLAVQDALDLLADVAQGSTQWSVVYGMSTGDVNVVIGQKYDNVHTFPLSLTGE